MNYYTFEGSTTCTRTLPQKRTQLLKLYYDTVYGMSKITLNNNYIYINNKLIHKSPLFFH